MSPPIVCVVGKAKTGKTVLMEKLVVELKKRGYRVATVKHSHHGFDLDEEGKDSWKHAQAGADTVVLSSPDKLAMIKKVDRDHTLAELSRFIGLDYDIILAEGFKKDNAFKIEVHRKEKGEDLLCTREELLAVASNEPLELNIPQYHLDNASGIADLIEKRFLQGEDIEVMALFVNGEQIPLSAFPKALISKTLLGMVTTLKKVSDPNSIDISVRRKP
ncbi:molybdopterin-guanine dinucleotide biosynthesis protein B [Chloroflexota bacterium]